jgi:osmotically inducible protein OsmC
MKPYTRKASVLWQGTRQRGKGAINTPSAVIKNAAYNFGNDIKRRGTNPPELIAAAHAGSFSMTLANELGEAGYSPRQIDTTATVTMEDIAAGWTMTQIHLDVIATVPKVAQFDFIDAALRAKANCPISRFAEHQHLDARQIEQSDRKVSLTRVCKPARHSSTKEIQAEWR